MNNHAAILSAYFRAKEMVDVVEQIVTYLKPGTQEMFLAECLDGNLSLLLRRLGERLEVQNEE